MRGAARPHAGDTWGEIEQAANSQEVIARVRAGDADVGFIETPDVPSDLGSVTVGSDALQIVVAPDHDWARERTIDLSALVDAGFVVRESGSGTRRALEAAVQSQGLSLTSPALVASTTLAIRSAVMAGVGPAALGSLAVRGDIAAGRLVAVTVAGLTIRRPFTAIWLGKNPKPLVRDLLEIVARAAG